MDVRPLEGEGAHAVVGHSAALGAANRPILPWRGKGHALPLAQAVKGVAKQRVEGPQVNEGGRPRSECDRARLQHAVQPRRGLRVAHSALDAREMEDTARGFAPASVEDR